MINIKEKKISIKLMLLSLFGMIISNVIKEPYEEHLKKWKFLFRKDINAPIHYFKVDFFGFEIRYSTLLVTLIVVMALGVYWFLTKTDAEIRPLFKNYLNRLKKALDKIYKALDKIYSFKADDKNIKGKTVNNFVLEIENKKTRKVKRRTLIIGFVFLILSLFEYYAISNRTEFYLYALLLMLVQKFFAATVCDQVKGGSWLWFVFGFAIPSVALIIAGLTLPSNNQVKNEK